MMGPAGDGTSPVTTHTDPLEDAGTTAPSCVLSQDFQPLVSFRNRTSLNSEGRSKDLLWGFILQKDHYVPPQSPPDDAIENFNLHCSCPNLCFWVFWGHLQPPSAPFLLDEKIKVFLDFGHKIRVTGADATMNIVLGPDCITAVVHWVVPLQYLFCEVYVKCKEKV